MMKVSPLKLLDRVNGCCLLLPELLQEQAMNRIQAMASAFFAMTQPLAEMRGPIGAVVGLGTMEERMTRAASCSRRDDDAESHSSPRLP